MRFQGNSSVRELLRKWRVVNEEQNKSEWTLSKKQISFLAGKKKILRIVKLFDKFKG